MTLNVIRNFYRPKRQKQQSNSAMKDLLWNAFRNFAFFEKISTAPPIVHRSLFSLSRLKNMSKLLSKKIWISQIFQKWPWKFPQIPLSICKIQLHLRKNLTSLYKHWNWQGGNYRSVSGKSRGCFLTRINVWSWRNWSQKEEQKGQRHLKQYKMH